jgi:hypothetical protein
VEGVCCGVIRSALLAFTWKFWDGLYSEIWRFEIADCEYCSLLWCDALHYSKYFHTTRPHVPKQSNYYAFSDEYFHMLRLEPCTSGTQVQCLTPTAPYYMVEWLISPVHSNHRVLEVLVYRVQSDKRCNCWSATEHQLLGVPYQTLYVATQSRPPEQLAACGQNPILCSVMQQLFKCICGVSFLCTVWKRVAGEDYSSTHS